VPSVIDVRSSRWFPVSFLPCSFCSVLQRILRPKGIGILSYRCVWRVCPCSDAHLPHHLRRRGGAHQVAHRVGGEARRLTNLVRHLRTGARIIWERSSRRSGTCPCSCNLSHTHRCSLDSCHRCKSETPLHFDIFRMSVPGTVLV
jgi:hypothetical protein